MVVPYLTYYSNSTDAAFLENDRCQELRTFFKPRMITQQFQNAIVLHLLNVVSTVCTCIVDSHPQTSKQKNNPPRVTSSLRSDGGIHYLSISNYFKDIIGLFGKTSRDFHYWCGGCRQGSATCKNSMVPTIAIYSGVTARRHHLKLVAIASLRTKLLLP